MCPACLTTAAIVLAGGASTGGLAAVLVKKFSRLKHKPKANARYSSNAPKETAP
jgi:hypothetical protein